MGKEQKYGDIEIKGIPQDEPVFVFRAQDVFAGHVLRQYAQMRTDAGDDAGAKAVLDVVNKFAEWPVKKIPD